MFERVSGILAVLAVSAVLLTSCIETETAITLSEDYSGTIGVSMSMDMEPMASFMATMQKKMMGDETPVTPEEIETAKKELLAQQEAKMGDATPEEQKAAVAKNMPEGVELVEFENKMEGLKMMFRALFSFDHVSKLSELGQSMGEGDGESTPMNQDMPNPIGGFQYADEGETFTLTMTPSNPADKAEESPAGADPAMKQQMEAAFSGMRITFKIDAPFEVVEHNADRQEGTTLFWDFDFAKLQTLKEGDSAANPFVRYKKKA